MSHVDLPDVTPGPRNVVIDVRAAGACFPDLLLSKGEYQLTVPPPFIPGMEVAGVAVPAAGVRRSPGELDATESVSLLVLEP